MVKKTKINEKRLIIKRVKKGHRTARKFWILKRPENAELSV